MSIYQRWMGLPFKARMYIGTSTFIVALTADYVLGRIEEESQARSKIEKELQSKP